MRVLDIDLDFFLDDVAHMADSSETRLDGEEFQPWAGEDVRHFLVDRCGLEGPRPGAAVEQHNEVFYLWGEAILSGSVTAPLDVVHVDAHADLGLGDAAYAYLIGDLAYQPITERYPTLRARRPRSRAEMLDLANQAVTDGNWLMFALACGWLSKLTYVSNLPSRRWQDGRPGDLMHPLMMGFEMAADHLQVVASREDFVMRGRGVPERIDGRDPPVAFEVRSRDDYCAEEPFDLVFLTRSPQYTPVESDPIYDAIRQRFIDEEAGF